MARGGIHGKFEAAAQKCRCGGAIEDDVCRSCKRMTKKKREDEPIGRETAVKYGWTPPKNEAVDPKTKQAVDAIRMPEGASGMSRREAENYLRSIGWDDRKIAELTRERDDSAWSVGESETTEAGLLEAYIDGLVSTQDMLEQTMATAGQVGYSPRDQGILGRQVAAHTQTKAPQIDWGQGQEQDSQIPQELQSLHQEYQQAMHAGDSAKAGQLRNQLAFELQLKGIDPAQVLR